MASTLERSLSDGYEIRRNNDGLCSRKSRYYNPYFIIHNGVFVKEFYSYGQALNYWQTYLRPKPKPKARWFTKFIDWIKKCLASLR